MPSLIHTWPDGNRLGVTGSGYFDQHAEGYPILVVGPPAESDGLTSHASSHASGGSDEIAINAAQITAGVLAIARGGTGAATAAANQVFGGPTGGGAAAPAFRALVAADIPVLDTSKLTTGQLGVARGGTGVDGSSQAINLVFASPGSGGAGAVALRALVAADIPALLPAKITGGSAGRYLRDNGTTGAWSTLTLPDTVTSGHVLVASGTNVVAGAASLTKAQQHAQTAYLDTAQVFTEAQSVRKDQNAATTLTVQNATDGASALARLLLQGDNNGSGAARTVAVICANESYTGTAAYQGAAVFQGSNVPKFLVHAARGSTAGDEVVGLLVGSGASYGLSVHRFDTVNRKVVSLFSSSPTDTGGDGLIYVGNRSGAPSSPPVGGFICSANSGVPTFRTSGDKIINLDQAAAYTQTYSTASRTVNAYTSNAQSGAYTGIDNAQLGSVYAALADLNALRVAYETLRASHDNLIQVVNSLIDDAQARGFAA